jgi:type I restriction enzyme S subunit
VKALIKTFPRNWETAQLGDLVEILDHLRIPVNRSERSERPGSYPYYGATGQVGWIDDYLFNGEYILLGEDGAPFLEPYRPKAYLVRGKFWVNNHAHVLKPKAGVLGQYLIHQLNQVNYRDFVSGTTRLKLPQAPMRRIPIRLAPEAEQQRIAAEIEKQLTRVDAGINLLERSRVSLRGYRAAVLKAACEGRLVPESAMSARLNRSRTLPKGWSWVSLSQVGSVIGGLTKNSSREKLQLKLPYLRVGNVYADELRLEDIRTIGVNPGELDRALLKPNDLLIVEGNGSEDQVGRVALWSGEISPCVHQNHIIKVRVHPPTVAKYVLMWLLSPSGRVSIRQVASSTSGLHTLSLSKVGAIPIALPPPAEQARIVAEVEKRLSILENLSRLVQDNLRRADSLRHSILCHAFSGGLVTQDPDDEPAAILLERIRQEHETAAESQPRRRDRRPAAETEKPRSRRAAR